jgi:hypothetical protein
MNEMLREAIADLDGRLQARDRELNQAHAQNREEQAKIVREISSLEQRLEALAQQQRLYEEQRVSVEEEHIAELLAVLTQGLRQSASSLVMAASFLLKKIHLVEEQARLLESEPELARQYEDYRMVEETRDTLPSSYLRFHEAVERRLAPYLRMKEQENGLRYDSPIFLLFMVAIDEEEGVAHWILPFPEESRLPDQGKSILSDQLMETMANAVAEVATSEDWHLANILSDLWWSGFPALVTSCKYDGEGRADESAERILAEYFATKSSLFQECELQVNVVEIGMEIWQRGLPGGKAAVAGQSEAKLAAPAPVNDGHYTNEEGQSIGGQGS